MDDQSSIADPDPVATAVKELTTAPLRPRNAPTFLEHAGQLGLLADAQHVSIRDLWLLQEAIDRTAVTDGLSSSS